MASEGSCLKNTQTKVGGRGPDTSPKPAKEAAELRPEHGAAPPVPPGLAPAADAPADTRARLKEVVRDARETRLGEAPHRAAEAVPPPAVPRLPEPEPPALIEGLDGDLRFESIAARGSTGLGVPGPV